MIFSLPPPLVRMMKNPPSKRWAKERFPSISPVLVRPPQAARGQTFHFRATLSPQVTDWTSLAPPRSSRRCMKPSVKQLRSLRKFRATPLGPERPRMASLRHSSLLQTGTKQRGVQGRILMGQEVRSKLEKAQACHLRVQELPWSWLFQQRQQSLEPSLPVEATDPAVTPSLSRPRPPGERGRRRGTCITAERGPATQRRSLDWVPGRQPFITDRTIHIVPLNKYAFSLAVLERFYFQEVDQIFTFLTSKIKDFIHLKFIRVVSVLPAADC